jgi:methylenetetrahydrofolate dehydrogenase (NADP+)/methenyltetrahydrofolate cyclohydrolase
MQLLDGNKVSEDIRDEIRADNPASKIYVRNKMQDCDYVGFSSTLKRLPANLTQEQLIQKVQEYNHDPEVDGIIVQMPLPEHIQPQDITSSIDPNKDVDGFHPLNVGLMTLNFPGLMPATPSGILELLHRYHISTKGKHCVVVGRSRIVGRPTSILMSRGGDPGEATVTICHKHTPPEELRRICPQADILIVAVGKPNLITAEMVKEGAIVIDVGMNRVEAPGTKSGYRLRGDVDFEAVAPKTSFITPVPGGVGPMTRAVLLRNTLEAFQRRHGMPVEDRIRLS